MTNNVTEENLDNNPQNVTGIDFIGEVTFETGFTFVDTEVGGISGLTYDRANNIYYALSSEVASSGVSPEARDDRSVVGTVEPFRVSFGETLPDGRQSIIVASNNNFNDTQFTQFLGFAIDTKTIPVPVPEGEDPADFQVEGMVVDRETGYLYVAQEFGIWKYNAEPNDNREPTLVDTVTEDRDLEQIPFSNLVVFGDSLSDTGNVFNATEGLVPPSPPYASGRFSNGDLIVDAIADYLELPENESFGLGGNNYAFGAAETGEGTSEYGFLLPEPIDVPNIGQQIDLYLADRTPTETDLFYIYGGINDFVSPLLRGETLPTPESIVGNITTHITELAEAGAQTFVVPNLLSLGDIPLFLEQPEATAILNDVTEEFNQLLDTELDAIASELDVEIIEPDIYSITTEIQDNPTDFGLSNTTDAFFDQTDPISDTTNLSLTGNPEEFFFWDIFHPTATATEIIAQEVIDLLPSGVTQFERETPSLVPNVEAINDLTPTVLSEFVVNPQLDSEPEPTGFNKVFGTTEADNLDITGARNFVFASNSDDVINLTNSEGNNRIYSGTGNDVINLGTEVTNPDIIADFELDSDTLGVTDASFEELTIDFGAGGAIVGIGDRNLAILVDVNPNNLTEDSFTFS